MGKRRRAQSLRRGTKSRAVYPLPEGALALLVESEPRALSADARDGGTDHGPPLRAGDGKIEGPGRARRAQPIAECARVEDAAVEPAGAGRRHRATLPRP